MPAPDLEIDDDADRALDDDDTADFPDGYSISSYGADYPVDSLVARLEKERGIKIPGFQRGYVWTQKQASRFVESLLLGLPVPGIFLCKEEASNKLIVIDGQQRLGSLYRFYNGAFDERVFGLKGVAPRFVNKTYKTLDEDDRVRLDDAVIHATVVKQERPEDDSSAIFRIFERLNTGGTPLSAHEIRSALYHELPLTKLLGEWNEDPHWRAIFGGKDRRLKNEELILRFIALYTCPNEYRRPMRSFLNDFLRRSRGIPGPELAVLGELFARTIKLVDEVFGRTAFRPERTLNAAVFDGVMVGLARRTAHAITDPTTIKQAYEELLADEHFRSAYKKSTADEESVRTRLELATKAFASVR